MRRHDLSPFRRERILRQGTEAVFQETDLPRLLGKVVERACVLLRADHGAVGLIEDEPQAPVVRIASVHNMPAGEVGSVWPPGVGLAGRVLDAKAPVVLARYGDAFQDSPPELSDHAVVGLPIMRRRRMVGYFGIGAATSREFGSEDVRLLRQFARACGTAIENARLLATTLSHLEDTRLQYELSIRLATATEVRDVVRAYLLHIARTTGFVTTVVLHEFSRTEERTHNVTVGQWSPEHGLSLKPNRAAHVRDQLDPLLDAGQAVWFSDVRTDPNAPPGLREAQARDGRPAVALVPMVSRGRRIGLVVLSEARSVDWDSRLVRPIVITVNHLASAIDTRQEHARLEAERDAARLNRERQKIARDLHDSVSQMLFAVHVECQTLGQGNAGSIDPEGFVRLREMTTSTLREMRSLLQELHPEEEGGGRRKSAVALEERLRRHAGEIGAQYELQFELRGKGPDDPALAHALFRIGQEALTNAHRHAEARTVRILIALEDGEWTLAVGDDGRGLARNGRNQDEPTFGLRGMHERAKELGGTLRLSKNRPRGTLVTCRIPAAGAR
ncbi:MAG: GAF domain-containing protein [Fimbriimonadaceae bacterium]